MRKVHPLHRAAIPIHGNMSEKAVIIPTPMCCMGKLHYTAYHHSSPCAQIKGGVCRL